MSEKRNKGFVVKRGVLGSPSGSYDDLIITKNGVIYVKKTTNKTRHK